MKHVLTLLLVGALLAITTTSHAYLTLFGPTGGAVLPTADIGQGSQFNLAVDFYNAEVDTVFPTRVMFSPTSNLEFGGLVIFDTAVDAIGLNAKFGFSLFRPGDTAIGGFFTDAVPDYRTTNVYAVHTLFGARRPDAMGFRVSVGANWTQVDIPLEGLDTSGVRGFASASLGLLDRALLSVEYQTRRTAFNETDALTSAVVRLPLSRALALQAGVTNVDPRTLRGTDDHNFFGGVTLNFREPAPAWF